MSALASLGISLASQFVGPAVSNVLSGARLQANYNAPAVGKYLQYWSNFLSTCPNAGAYQRELGAFNVAGDNYSPLKMSGDQLIRRFNQFDWSRVDGDQSASDRVWRWLQRRMRWNGIDMAVPLQLGANGVPTQGTTREQLEWLRLIEMQSGHAPLASVLRDYWRGRIARPELPTVTEEELKYNLSRAELRRKHDRDRILSPFFSWSPVDALRLKWLGVIGNEEFKSIVSAAGIVRSRDAAIFDAVSRPIPDASTLQGWSVRRLWDEGIATKYDLDAGRDDSPVARFFMRSQGAGIQQPALPGQPAGNADWAALGYRATRPLPDFRLAAVLQHRLRPNGLVEGESVVDGVPTWGATETEEMLRVEGFTEPIIKRLMALVYEPLNIRLINHVLSPLATHPDVAAAALEAFGHPTQWIESAMLDHGFAPPLAKVAAAGILAQADDRANAERIEHEKRLRQIQRDAVLARYRTGLVTFDDALIAIQDKFFTETMARQELAIITTQLADEVTKVKVKALHDEWISGKLSAGNIAAELTAQGITDARAAQYVEEWTWERTSKTRMLTTGEILAGMKAGLISPPIALSRLVNLGWSQPDAVIEIAQVERDLAMAASKTAAAMATHQAVAAAKAHAEQIAKAHAEATAIAKQRAYNVKIEKSVQLAAHQKLLANDEYYAKVHAANDAFAKADAKGNEQKKLVEIQKSLAAYQRYLIERLKLIQEGPEVANVPPEPAVDQAPLPQSGAGVSASTQPATPADSGSTGQVGGSGTGSGP